MQYIRRKCVHRFIQRVAWAANNIGLQQAKLREGFTSLSPPGRFIRRSLHLQARYRFIPSTTLEASDYPPLFFRRSPFTVNDKSLSNPHSYDAYADQRCASTCPPRRFIRRSLTFPLALSFPPHLHFLTLDVRFLSALINFSGGCTLRRVYIRVWRRRARRLCPRPSPPLPPLCPWVIVLSQARCLGSPLPPPRPPSFFGRPRRRSGRRGAGGKSGHRGHRWKTLHAKRCFMNSAIRNDSAAEFSHNAISACDAVVPHSFVCPHSVGRAQGSAPAVRTGSMCLSLEGSVF